MDAAIGGKTAINIAAGKNLVGAFHPPAGVLADLDTLATLPRREYVSGLAEVIKAGFIADPVILDLIEQDPAGAATPGGPHERELVERAIRMKAAVVAADLREAGQREMLNYGHTLGHAIERAEDYTFRHGEAVADRHGLRRGRRQAGWPAGRADGGSGTGAILAAVGLPTTLPGGCWPRAAATRWPSTRRPGGQHLRLVVLDGLARPGILADPPEELLARAYAGGAEHADGARAQRAEPGQARVPRARRLRHGDLDDLRQACAATAAELGLAVDFRQTDDESQLIAWVHEAADGRMPIVLNPAAFTHYSYALRDALAMRTAPLVEVHYLQPRRARGVPAQLRGGGRRRRDHRRFRVRLVPAGAARDRGLLAGDARSTAAWSPPT